MLKTKAKSITYKWWFFPITKKIVAVEVDNVNGVVKAFTNNKMYVILKSNIISIESEIYDSNIQ